MPFVELFDERSLPALVLALEKGVDRRDVEQNEGVGMFFGFWFNLLPDIEQQYGEIAAVDTIAERLFCCEAG